MKNAAAELLKAVQVVIAGRKGDDNLHFYLRNKFGEKASNDFRAENLYRAVT